LKKINQESTIKIKEVKKIKIENKKVESDEDENEEYEEKNEENEDNEEEKFITKEYNFLKYFKYFIELKCMNVY
jgi:ABC-type Zn2+ transport system substrate-binding protein/surface adhesin